MNSVSMQADPGRPFTGIRTTQVEVTHDPWILPEIGSPTTPTKPKKPTTAYVYPKLATENYSITITAPQSATEPARTPAKFIRRPTGMDKVKWAYTKVALLFAISILITWVPASANRVYGLRYPDHPSYALNVGSALVLPLQGFWNTVIFFSTSLGICRGVWARFVKRRRAWKGADELRRLGMAHIGAQQEKEGESMVELSRSPGESF